MTTSSTTPGELTLYLGNFAAEAELTVSLPGSAPFVVNHSTQHPGDRVSFTIEFQADNVGDVLTAEWRQTGITNSGFSNLQIIAATLDFQTPAAPTITSDGGGETASVNAAESQTAATDVQATDDNDAEGAGLVYSLSGGADHASFSIDANTGVLTFNTDPDFENPTDAGGDNVYDVQVTVTDAGSLADVQDIAVTVTDVNEAPSVALINTTNSLVENIDTGSSIKVADIVVTDDALGTNTLSLSGIDAVMFEITGTELFLKAGSTVDFETNPVLDVTVEVDDATVGGTPDDFAALAINVIDIDPVHVTCEVIDDVQALKDAGELGNGQVNPIINHLGQAKASLAKGKISHAIKKLEQGRDELQDLVDGGGLDAGLAIQLEAFVKSLNDVITEIQSGSA